MSISASYRPEIDGLRAVAVLSVVLYHAGFAGFSGGYVGVDVFLVISGFLITRLLMKELEEKGSINFFRFYLRRLRRLLPAFFFTLFFSSVLAFWLLSPLQLEAYGASLIHAVLSVSNLYFYAESGYFDTAASAKPLLHTWTLGVEEQFYLIWPFLLSFLAPKQWRIPLFVASMGLFSLVFSVMLIRGHANAVFFLMPFRIFEFSLGAILVWIKPLSLPKQNLLDLLLAIGLSLIAIAVFNYDEKTVFPGANALLPCVGAALCIYAGNARHLGVLLNNRLLVGVGLISYSLYLIHWPILVFYKNLFMVDHITVIESTLLVMTAIIMAAWMYFWIERPFRKIQTSNTHFLLVCVLCSFGLSYLGASWWATGGWTWRPWAGISGEVIKHNRELRFQTWNKRCAQQEASQCNMPVVGAVNALIIGDSHAPDAFNAFAAIYPAHHFTVSTLGGCPPYHNIELLTSPTHPDRMQCKTLNESRFDPSYLHQFDYIVINVLLDWYTPAHLAEYLKFLKDNQVKKVIVFGNYLALKRDMYDLLNEYGYNSAAMNAWVIDNPEFETTLSTQVTQLGYLFLSKREVFCKTGHCTLFDQHKIPFTHDAHHLSYEFAVQLGNFYRQPIERYLGLKPVL